MRLLVVCLAILCLLAAARAESDVIIKYNKLFVDGKEYIVKGMSYNPAPITFLNNTGLCSRHQDFVANQFYSACYDSDFFDGYTYPGHPYPVPANGWFSPLWERDLPQMAAIGINTLRIYNVNPSNYLAWERYKGQYLIDFPGKDHIPFLDACHAYGIKVVWPLFSDVNYLRTLPDDRLRFYMRTTIEEVGNHPALLMYSLGNEMNYVDGSNFESWVEVLHIAGELMKYARDYQRTTWNRLIPFTTGTDDNNLYYDWLASLVPVDVFMPNAGYRGQPMNNIWNFYNLWSGAAYQNFSGWYKLSCKYQIPVLIGEMNPVGYENPPVGSGPHPTGFPQLWKDLLDHVSQGAIGGFFFEWNDEPWKAFGRQDKLGINSVSVYCDGTGKCSDQENVLLADTLTRKGWEFDAVAIGQTEDGKNYNYGADVFALLGRPQQTLQTVTNDCPAEYWDGSFPERGGYVSQYYLYPPSPSPTSSTTLPPTSAPVTSNPPPTTASPAPSWSVSPSPSPTIATTSPPPPPPSDSPSPPSPSPSAPSPPSISPSAPPPPPTTTVPKLFTISSATTIGSSRIPSQAAGLFPMLAALVIAIATLTLLL